MSARAETGGPVPDNADERTHAGGASALWIVLLALIFLAAVGGGYAIARGRISAAAQPAVAPTAVTVATAAPTRAAPTAAATSAARAASAPTPAAQATLTSDQAAASYLWQQSHEEQMCSCNTANPPSSP